MTQVENAAAGEVEVTQADSEAARAFLLEHWPSFDGPAAPVRALGRLLARHHLTASTPPVPDVAAIPVEAVLAAVRDRRDNGGGSAGYRQACNHIIEAVSILAKSSPAAISVGMEGADWSNREGAAWFWIDQRYNRNPLTGSFDASDMVEAFHAGYAYTPKPAPVATGSGDALAQVVHKNGPVVIDWMGTELAWRPLDYGTWTALSATHPTTAAGKVQTTVRQTSPVVADYGEHFLVAHVSADGKMVGIDHPCDAKWSDVMIAHVALRDRINERIAEQDGCPFKPRTMAADNGSTEGVELSSYDPGLLGNGGGGDIEWWQDYIRAELARAHDFYGDQFENALRGLQTNDGTAAGWVNSIPGVRPSDQFIAADRRALEGMVTRARAALTADKPEAQGLLDWLSDKHRLSLQHHSPMYGDDDDQSVEWRVERESGPINDREWETVGRGETPAAAIAAARTALNQGDR